MVNESNFTKICLVLYSEESFTALFYDVVLCYSILSSITETDAEELHLDTLVQTLSKEQFLTKAESKQIYKHRPFSKPNKKQGIINVLSSKALKCFSNFLRYLENETMHYNLQIKILEKMSVINNAISYTRSVSSTTLVSICTSQSSDRTSTQHMHENRMHKSTLELESSYSGAQSSCQTDFTRWTSSSSCTKSINNGPSSPLINELKHHPSQLDTYSEHLKRVHQRLPKLSRQGWTNYSNTDNHFINVTVVKSQNVGKNTEYSTSFDEILDHQMQYSGEALKIYNKMFEAIDSKTFQLILLEGNAGTGKTTLAFKFCKDWGEGNALSQYSHVILLQLRDIKDGMMNEPEKLFSKMGKLEHQIYAEMVVSLGSGVLFWLEGWDELVDNLKFYSVFTDLLKGQLFPKATVVVSTRPSATGSLKQYYTFTHKFKLVGFKYKQIEEYVHCYCTDSDSFMSQLNHVPSLAQLAEVPMNLAILVKLFKQTSQDLPNTLTEIFYDYLMNILQHHKYKNSESKSLVRSTQNLPPEMQKIFDTLTKYAFEHLFHHKPFSEEEISDTLFHSSDVPWDFDGLGMFEVQNRERVTGESKDYIFLYKPIQELLAALYLTTLDPKQQLIQLKEIFGNKGYEMVWVFYAGITELHVVPIDIILREKFNISQLPQQSVTQLPAKTLQQLVKAWKCCHSYFMHMTIPNEFSIEFLLTLILCCYEARNKEACRIIAMHVYPDIVCRIEIPPNRVTPYLLLAVSYFISHSTKMWSLRCEASIQSGVELLCKYITDPDMDEDSIKSGLWVWCYVVKSSQIDAYCKAIKSQSSLQWIHLLNGSSLGDDGTVKLCDCLSFDCTVIKVEIENCKIGSRGLKSIGHMLNINGKILHIDLRKNSFLLEDVRDFLCNIKNQIYLEYLLLDKEFTKNFSVTSILKEINSIRRAKNASILKISHQ